MNKLTDKLFIIDKSNLKVYLLFASHLTYISQLVHFALLRKDPMASIHDLIAPINSVHPLLDCFQVPEIGLDIPEASLHVVRNELIELLNIGRFVLLQFSQRFRAFNLL